MFQFNSMDLEAYQPNDSYICTSKKITPGPYRATKLWNGIVKAFVSEMICKKHRKHFRTYQNCFTASEAVDFLHKQLMANANIGKDVNRNQTIQLLKKFLKNHVIEDIVGKWGTENFEDDGKLYRFQRTIPIAKSLRKPLATIDENAPIEKTQKKNKKKNRKSLVRENSNQSMSSLTSSSSEKSVKSDMPKQSQSPTRPLPPVPEFPRCKVKMRDISEDEINEVWKNKVFAKLKEIMKVSSLKEMIIENDIQGSFVKHNCTKLGKSGVVQVSKEGDLPYWALSAMTCLANWPHGRETGLPCYPGFEKDVYKAVCAYYLGNENSEPLQPLLTYDLYELFTNIVCLLQPSTIPTAIEAARYALLLLPSENRRKLHLLLRLLSKMSKNQHLNSLSAGKHMSTRYMLINSFSQRILGCNEEVYLDEILAVQLTKFLIDHHNILLKVPSDIEQCVNDQIIKMKQVMIKYSEPETNEPYFEYGFVNPHGVKMRQKNYSRKNDKHNRRKSADIIKSWDKLVTNIKSKPFSQVPLNDARDNATVGRPQNEKVSDNQFKPQQQHAKRTRSTTITSRLFGSGSSNGDLEPTKKITRRETKKARMKAARSCPDIADVYSRKSTLGAVSTHNLQEKSNRRSSMVFSGALSKLRRSRDTNLSNE